jgi:hypothetical protein
MRSPSLTSPECGRSRRYQRHPPDSSYATKRSFRRTPDPRKTGAEPWSFSRDLASLGWPPTTAHLARSSSAGPISAPTLAAPRIGTVGLGLSVPGPTIRMLPNRIPNGGRRVHVAHRDPVDDRDRHMVAGSAVLPPSCDVPSTTQSTSPAGWLIPAALDLHAVTLCHRAG